MSADRLHFSRSDPVIFYHPFFDFFFILRMDKYFRHVSLISQRVRRTVPEKDRRAFHSKTADLKMCIRDSNGIENGLFQLTKVALSSITALFGTVQIAANGVAQSFWSVAALMGTSLGLAFVTVIGQCMGAGDTDAAEYYMKKLLRITFLASILWNALILLAAPLVLKGYALSDEAADLVVVLVIIHNIFNALFYPLSGALANGLRAAGDVKFTMYVSIFSTIGCRVVFSVLFGICLNMGVIGIAFAMCLDWMIRAAFFWARFRKGKWKEFRVIGQ